MRRSVSIAVLAVALVFGMGTIAVSQKNFLASAQEKPATTEVKIDNFSFGPATLTVPVGTSVTWTNRDDIPHTVVSTEGVFKSKEVHFYLQQSGKLSVFLLDSPENDRQGHRAMSEEKTCIHSTSKRRCLRNMLNTWS